MAFGASLAISGRIDPGLHRGFCEHGHLLEVIKGFWKLFFYADFLK